MTRTRAVDPNARRFGAIVSRLRSERRWTLTDLARASGIHRTSLGLLEHGEYMPTLAVIIRLAKAFGVEASELMRRIEQARAAE